MQPSFAGKGMACNAFRDAAAACCDLCLKSSSIGGVVDLANVSRSTIIRCLITSAACRCLARAPLFRLHCSMCKKYVHDDAVQRLYLMHKRSTSSGVEALGKDKIMS